MTVSLSTRQKRSLVLMIALAACLWPDSVPAQPKRPDNAALLYYQATIERSRLQEPRDFWKAEQGDVPPDDDARQFLGQGDSRAVIELLNAATEIPACEWGLTPSGKWCVGGISTTLLSLGLWLSVDARIRADDGHYREAFEGVLRLRRLARHVGDDVFRMWTAAQTLDAKAFFLVQDILGWMPPDATMVTWLESELTRQGGAPWRPRESLAAWRDMEIEIYRASPEEFAFWKDFYFQKMTDQTLVEELRNLSDAKLLERMREAYNVFMKQVIEILDNEASYQEKYAQITKLIEEVHAEAKQGSVMPLLYPCVDTVDEYYDIHMNATAYIHAVKAALDIYRIKAETGKLPEALPDGLPGDPYSGENFDYEITEEGFTLRCRAMAVNYSQGPRQFEFTVRQDNAN